MSSLHPEAKERLVQLEQAGIPPMHSLSVSALRDMFADMAQTDTGVNSVAVVREFAIPGPNGEVPVRVYEPSTTEPPYRVVTYLHGGGWVMGSLDSVDSLCRRLTEEANCMTVSVEYRLAPEHPFPAGLQDCYAVVRWLAENADTIGGNPDRLGVAGDSAGGNLTAAVTLLSIFRGSPDIAYQLLVYPQLNYAFDTDSYRENANGYYLTRTDMQRFWADYLADDLDGYHPLASPLRARDEDLEALPPTHVLTCGFDPLRDDGATFAERLQAVGVKVTHTQYADMIHGFFRQVAELDVAREAVDAVSTEIRSIV